MAWTPKYVAILEELLVSNLKRIIQRDAAEAITYVNTGHSEELPNFLGFYTAEKIVAVRYPFVIVRPDRGSESEEQDVEERHRLAVQIAALNADPELLTTQVMRYRRAVDLIMRTATSADLLQGTTAGKRTKVTLDLPQYLYGKMMINNQSSYLLMVYMAVDVSYSEL